MDFFDLLIWLIAFHFLCDFALQNDYVAINKNPTLPRNKPNPIWGWVMTAHCAIHALSVMWLTGNVKLAIFMFVTHFIIDFSKCKEKISFNTDQILHLLVLAFIAFVAANI